MALPLFLSGLMGGLGKLGSGIASGASAAGKGIGSFFANPNVQNFGSGLLSSMFNNQQNPNDMSQFNKGMSNAGMRLNNPMRIAMGMLPQYAKDAPIGNLGQRTGQHLGQMASNAFSNFMPQQFQGAQLGNLGQSMGDYFGSKMSEKWQPFGRGLGYFLGGGLSSLFNQGGYGQMQMSQIPQHVGSQMGSMFDRNVTSRLPQQLQQSTLSTMGSVLGNELGNKISRGMGYAGGPRMFDVTGLNEMPFANDMEFNNTTPTVNALSPDMGGWNALPFAGGGAY